MAAPPRYLPSRRRGGGPARVLFRPLGAPQAAAPKFSALAAHSRPCWQAQASLDPQARRREA